MSKDIRIKKGLDIKLIGAAEKTTKELSLSSIYAVKPEDFHGITPKLVAKEGAEVKAGEDFFIQKVTNAFYLLLLFLVEVVEVIRGARRKVLAVKISADKHKNIKILELKMQLKCLQKKLKNHLLASGCWPFVKQRPYDVVANPNQAPKAIFVSGYASAPLAADLDYTLAGKEAELQAAVTALSKLTEGKVHVSVGANSNSPLANLNGITS